MSPLGGIRLDQVIEDDLLNLIGVEESRTFDVKVQSYGQNDIKELPRDVTAFANTAGGDILIGVAETDGKVSAVDGIDGPIDDSVLRLTSVINTHVSPRVPYLEIRPIPLANGRHVIVIRIPRSWVGPHMTGPQDGRFYYRETRGNARMDVDQLRDTFLAGPSFNDRLRQFRVDRVAKIAAGAAPVSLANADALIVHVLPRGMFGATKIPVNAISRCRNELVVPDRPSSREVRFNLEGVLATTGPAQGGPATGYVQFGKDGSYEMVTTGIVSSMGLIVHSVLERDIFLAVWRAFSLSAALELERPLAVMVSLVGVAGAKYQEQVGYRPEGAGVGFDRPIVLTEELVLEEFSNDDETAKRSLVPIFHELANANGWPKSPLW
jgi:hypothetical protein